MRARRDAPYHASEGENARVEANASELASTHNLIEVLLRLGPSRASRRRAALLRRHAVVRKSHVRRAVAYAHRPHGAGPGQGARHGWSGASLLLLCVEPPARRLDVGDARVALPPAGRTLQRTGEDMHVTIMVGRRVQRSYVQGGWQCNPLEAWPELLGPVGVAEGHRR